MTGQSDGKTQKAKTHAPRRGRKGFVQAGSLMENRLRKATEKRGFAETRLLTDWPHIAGVALAGIARPVKVSYARDGFGATLTVLTDGAHAPEVQMQLPALRERVNACYGYNAISRIRLTQTASAGFAEDKAAFEHAQPARPEPPAEKLQEMNIAVAPIGDEGLRQALEQLGRNVLSRN